LTQDVNRGVERPRLWRVRLAGHCIKDMVTAHHRSPGGGNNWPSC